MLAEPAIVERPEQPYVGIRQLVTMETIAGVADRIPELFGWLANHGVEPVGAPFFRYHVIDMQRELDVEVGIPIAGTVAGDDRVRAGVLPAGRYAAAVFVGHPDELVGATASLLDWADRQGLAWDKQPTEQGERWGCRLEIYETDPAEQPDPHKWETELAFRLAD
jgi:effector-binding domain-containing protein